MGTLKADGGGGAGADTASLCAAQVGNGVTTNVIDRGARMGPALLKIVTAIGATPTCTYAIEGSPDGVSWFAIPYSDSATPETISVATFVITTAITAWKYLQANRPWRYLRVAFSANTNVTNTVDVFTT